MTQKGRTVSLSATNAGDRRIRLASVKISSGAQSVSLGPGLAGYALGHSAMSWTAPPQDPDSSRVPRSASPGRPKKVRSMHKRWCKRRRDIGKALIIAGFALGVAAMPGLAKAEGVLQLEVLLNGRPIGLIGSFLQDAKGQLSAKRKELEALHLKVPEQFAPDDDVPLASLPGVTYRYDEAKQTVDFTVGDTRYSGCHIRTK